MIPKLSEEQEVIATRFFIIGPNLANEYGLDPRKMHILVQFRIGTQTIGAIVSSDSRAFRMLQTYKDGKDFPCEVVLDPSGWQGYRVTSVTPKPRQECLPPGAYFDMMSGGCRVDDGCKKEPPKPVE